MANTVKDPTQDKKTSSAALFRVLFVAALIILGALAVVCGFLIFRQSTLLDRESELDRQAALLQQETDRLEKELDQLGQELEDSRRDREDQQTRLDEQQTQLDEQQARIEAQQAQLKEAQDTIEQMSRYTPYLPEGQIPEYTSLFPDFYAPVWTGEKVTGGRMCYLTFDDGPSANTDRILEILDRYGIKATFFVTGASASTAAGKERLRRIADAGHTIGMHSWTHNYYQVYGSVEDFLDEFSRLSELIYQVTEVHPTVFRFPGGSINGYNRGVYQEIIAEMTRRGFVYYDWNESAGDATSTPRSADLIAQDCLKGIGRGLVIVLAHDNAARTTTVEALPTVIEGYQAAGYTFAGLHPGVTSVMFGYPKIT